MPNTNVVTRINGPWATLLAIVLVTTIIIAGKAVLVPLALGIILAFMLSPLVRLFDRMRLPRFIGVVCTMSLALSAVGAIGYVTWTQFVELSAQANQYSSSMRRKTEDLRIGDDAAVQRLTRAITRVTEQLDDNAAELRAAQPVRVVPQSSTAIQRMQGTIETIFEPMASAIIVLVLVAFMLGQREDLRDRFIRLIGAGNVTITTRLMDEAAHRVSRFIVAQTLVNIAFGTLVALGLYWIGVPYAALWGGLTAVLRFVPYVGTLLSGLMPALLAFAIFPGWSETLQTLGLFIVLDVVAAYVVEPVLFGHRTGVSSFALLISALFWIWAWGPIGLLLATPLTVCIAVIGRHVRSLRFLAIMFADEPALLPHVRYYQRLLARDEDEAHAAVQRKIDEAGTTAAMDIVLIPALSMALQHRAQNEITEDDFNFVLDATNDIVQHFRASGPASDDAEAVIGLATQSPVDRTLLKMLSLAVNSTRARFEPLEGETSLAAAVAKRPPLYCIVSLSPTRGSEVRGYCRQVRADHPDAKVLVLRPNVADTDSSRSATRTKEAGADRVTTTIAGALEAIEALCPTCPPIEGGEPDLKEPLTTTRSERDRDVEHATLAPALK